MASGSKKPTTSVYSKTQGREMDFTTAGTAIVEISNTPLAVGGTALTTLAGAIHNEDEPHVSTDPGIQVLTVRQDNANKLADTDGDYQPLTTSEHGCLNIDPQHYLSMDDCDSTDGWSVINNDTDNLATATNHVWKTASLSFDKVNGAGNTVYAGIQKTLGGAISLNKFIEEGGGFFLGSVFFTSLADVSYAWFRVGTDSSNYNEWRVSVDEMTAGSWMSLRGAMTAPHESTGNGWDSSAVGWFAIGAAFSNQTDTLAGILVDALFVNSGLQTSADITSQVQTAVASPNVNVKKWGPSIVSTDKGNSDSGSFRVAVATDDTNLSVISGAVTSTTAAKQMQVDVAGALPTGTNTIGKVNLVGGTTSQDVQIAGIDGGVTIPISGSVTAGGTVLENIRTAVQIVDDWDRASDRCGILIGGVSATNMTALKVHGAVTATGSVTVAGEVQVVQATAADLKCTEASAAAILTTMSILADWDESDRCKVNVQATVLGAITELNKTWEHDTGNKTGTGNVTILAAAGASKYNYIKSLVIVNNDDANMKFRIVEHNTPTEFTTLVETVGAPAFGGQMPFYWSGKGRKQPTANDPIEIDFVTSGASPDYTWLVEYATGA